MSRSLQQCTVLAVELTGSPWNRRTSPAAAGSAAQSEFIAAQGAAVVAGRGELVRQSGSELVAVFTVADSGYHAAVRMLASALKEGFDLRAGLHLGRASGRLGDPAFDQLLARTVQASQRAGPGELLLTGEVYPYLCSHFREQSVAISGRGAHGSDLYAYKKQEGDQTILGSFEAPPETEADADRIMVIAYGDREYLLTLSSEAVTIGRAPDNAIVLSDSDSSRRHATIEIERGCFVLRDQSTNGTYLLDASGERHHLHRESNVLTGSGRISFGNSAGLGGPGALAYRVEDQRHRS